MLSMSDGSSLAGNLLRIMYKSLMAIFTQCLTDILLTNIRPIYIYIILFHESRHFYHITIEWGRLYCIDTPLSQHGEHLIYGPFSQKGTNNGKDMAINF